MIIDIPSDLVSAVGKEATHVMEVAVFPRYCQQLLNFPDVDVFCF